MTCRPDILVEAMDILDGWPWFRDQFKDVHHFHARLVLPNRVGQLHILRIPEGRVLYSWTRLSEPCFDLPEERHWTKDGALLWLCDMVYDKGVTARQAIEAVSNDLIDRGVAPDGGRIYFYRGSHDRYGFGPVRRTKRDV